MVEVLLKNGADRNLVNKSGETALALAEKEYSQNGNESYKEIVDILKDEIKADVQPKND